MTDFSDLAKKLCNDTVKDVLKLREDKEHILEIISKYGYTGIDRYKARISDDLGFIEKTLNNIIADKILEQFVDEQYKANNTSTKK